MTVVRLIMPSDVDDVVDLVRAQVEESAPHLTFDAARTRRTAKAAVRGDPTVFVAEGADRRPIGYAYCLLQAYAFARGTFVVLESLYVRPANRGTRAAAHLITEFLRWGAVVGARECIMGVTTGVDADRKRRFFERMGVPHVGSLHKLIRG